MVQDEALSLFIVTCREQLDELERLLLALERAPDDRALLDAVFRTAHTIKGNAMVVRQTEIEWFAHAAESVLVRLRDRLLLADSQLVSVLLNCCDHLRFLIGIAEQTEDFTSPGFSDIDRAGLIGTLVAYLGEAEALGPPPVRRTAPPSDLWRLQVRFGRDIFAQGCDPASILQHLSTIGTLGHLIVHTDELPPASEYDPKSCYLHFEFDLETTADRCAIEEAFEFAGEGCELRITPPDTRIEDYVGRIRSLPAEPMPTGEMLLQVGALTAAELASCLQSQQREAESHKPIGAILVEQACVPQRLITAVLDRQKAIREELAIEQHPLHIPPGRIEELIHGLDDIHASLSALAARGTRVTATEMQALAHSLGKARQMAADMKTTRFGELLRHMHRTVRDTCVELGKRADLLVSGSELTLDRSIAEQIGDAIQHLLRNAIDHGLELPQNRIELGKPARGNLSVDARREGSQLVFSVADDGSGINRERIRQIAIERGFIASDHAPLRDGELFALMFRSGFSTAATVTHVSGRGVGLDVVYSIVATFGGDIAVSSFPNRGTIFELRVPDYVKPATTSSNGGEPSFGDRRDAA